MKSQKKSFLTACVLATGLVLSSPAFGLRCGSHVIQLGDTKGEVIAKCGKPDPYSTTSYVNREGRSVRLNGIREHYASYHVVEKWTYNFGPKKFNYTLIFDNGQLVDMQREGYGY